MSNIDNPLHLRPGANYAPVKPLLAIKNRQKENIRHYLADAIKERYDHFMARDKEVWQDLISVGHLTSMFIQGKQNLKWNGLTKSYYTVPVHKKQGDQQRTTPLMRFYTNNLEARYISSNPKINVIAAREDDKAVQAAQGARIVVDYHEKELYKNWKHRDEALLLMSFGTHIHRGKWNSGAKGFKAFKEIFEDRKFPISPGLGQCFECGHTGTGNEYLAQSPQIPSCPECASFNVYHEPPTTQIMPVSAGRKEINLGAIEDESLEFPACRWNLRHRAEDSSYFIYEQMTSAGVIQRLLGDVEIPEDKGGGNSFGLDVVKNLALAGLAINGKTTSNDIKTALYRNEIKLTEAYFSASDLAGINTGVDEETLCGEALPKGKRYSDLFPDGLVAVGLNGFNILLGVYRESHREQLDTQIWHNRQYSGAGQGVSDTVELNRRYNENDTQGYLATKLNATPATTYIEGAIDKEYLQYLGKPDVAIPINLDNVPQNMRSISDIIGSPRLGQVDAALLQYQAENLKNMMQLTSGDMNFSGGMPGVNNRTATGAKIGDAMAASIMSPMLSSKVDTRISKAKRFVRLYVENVPVAQFFPFKSKYGASQGVYLSGADLDTDFVFEIIENSELTKNAYTIREDNDRFFMAVGGLAGLLELMDRDPEMANELMMRYGVDFERNHFDEVASICRERFENARKLLAQFTRIQAQMEAQIQPNAGVSEPPTSAPLPEDISMEQKADGSYGLPEGGSTLSNEDLPDEDSSAPQESERVSPVQNEQTALAATSPAPVQQSVPPQMPPEVNQFLAQQVIGALERPITLYEPNNMAKAEWFSNFLDTDEGGKLAPDMRHVIYAFIDVHALCEAQKGATMGNIQGQVAVAAQVPGQIADAQKQQFLAQNNPKNNQRK